MKETASISLFARDLADQGQYQIFERMGRDYSPNHKRRRMPKSELLGQDSYSIGNGIGVHQETLARGKYQIGAFEVTELELRFWAA